MIVSCQCNFEIFLYYVIMTHCLPIFLVRQMSEWPFNCYDQMTPLSDKSNIMLQRLVQQQQRKQKKYREKVRKVGEYLRMEFQKGISEWGWHLSSVEFPSVT